MPKRKRDEDTDKYIRRKMRKIEKKLRKRSKKRSRLISSSSDSGSIPSQSSPVPSVPEDGQELSNTESLLCNDISGLPSEDVDLEIIEPISGPSTSAPAEPEESTLDDDIMKMLGASPTKNIKMGENIQKDLALRWEHITTSGLSKEARKELLDKHLIPANCSKLAAPQLNPEIKAAMSDTIIGKDKATEQKQNQMASAISCIGEALTKMFNAEHKDSSVIKSLIEGTQLLCDLQFCESMKRRSLICSSIKKEIKSQLYETEIDRYLFGEKLADTLKAAKAISKSGSEIKLSKPKATARPTRNLNLKPQLATGRQPTKRKQVPAAYTQAPNAYPFTAPQQQRQYLVPPPPPPLPPPPPPPPAPQAAAQQRLRRPYQRH